MKPKTFDIKISLILTENYSIKIDIIIVSIFYDKNHYSTSASLC